MDDPTLLHRIEEHLPRIAEIWRISCIPALSFGVFHNGKITYTAHLGKKDIRSSSPPDYQSVYRVGSTFKIVTACAVSRLVTEGVLRWDVPINAYLPHIRRTDAFGLNATLIDLLSNRTGLPMANCFWGQQNGEQLLPKTQFVHIVDNLKTVKPLGTSFIYSQWNFCLVQLVIERVTGKRFGDCVDEIIFKPLGLRSPTFDEPFGSNVAEPHAIRDDGSAAPILTSHFDSVSGLAAGTGGKSNLDDQLLLYIALLEAYEHQILHDVDTTPNSPFTQLRRIFAPHVSIPGSSIWKQGYCLGLYRSQLPANLSCASLNAGLPPRDLPIFPKGEDNVMNETIYHHTGNVPGFVSAMFLVPRTKSGVVALSNATPLTDAPDLVAQLLLAAVLNTAPPKDMTGLARKAFKIQFGWWDQLRLVLENFKTETPPTHPLVAYVGDYYNSLGNFKIVVTKMKQGLVMSMQGMPLTTYELECLDGDSFFWPADRENEIVARGMMPMPFPHWHVVQFDSNGKDVHSLTWRHDRHMDAETFVKQGRKSRL